MYFVLQRYSDNGDSTLGLLFERTNGTLFFESHVLEDEHRDKKVAGETRIDADVYELKIQTNLTPLTKKYRERYNWFENHIEVIGLPRHTSVYVHIGNDDGDTDGCLLLGDLVNNNRIGPGTVQRSTQAFKRWYQKVYPHLKEGGKAYIDIRDEKRLVA